MLSMIEPQWYDIPKDKDEDGLGEKLARKVKECVQDIERRQQGISAGNRRHAKIYAGYLPTALSWGTSPQSNERAPFMATKAIIRSVCDTATALIVRSRPKSSIVTDGADWKIQQQAEDLDQFMVGAFEVSDIYQVAPRAFHDSTIFGTGGWKYIEYGEGEEYCVKVERFLIDDIIVDEEECREHLEPENLYHRIQTRADALIKKYGGEDSPKGRRIKNAISAAANNGSGWPGRHVSQGRVILVEAYNRLTHRRILCCGDVVLEDTVWPHDFFPFTFLWWTLPISGFYGDGIAYRQFGRQERITYMYRWIQRCHDLFATPRAWVDPTGGPPTMQISNELGAIISSRRKPEFQTQQQVVPPEVYRWLDNLEKGGHEDEGISQVTAQNELPPGLESAPAQREYSFKEGQRFAPVSQRWEHAIAVEACEKMTAMYRQHFGKSSKRPKMAWADMRLMHTISWPDLKADAYRIRPEPSGLESLSPASRAQAAQEMANTGWITPAEGRALVGHPDMKQSADLDNAPINYAKYVLRQLTLGKKLEVDELADLTTLDTTLRKGRLVVILKNGPQKIIDNIGEFIEALQPLMAPPPQPQQTPLTGPAAPAMAPSGAAGNGMPIPLAK